jgi:RNA polymerase sigma-70 factor (ECF subfamily)
MIAEDLVAESIVKLWMLMQEKEIEHPQALLLVLLKNKTLDFLKHETVRRVAEKELAEACNREMNIRISTLEACDPENIFLSEVKEIIEQTLRSLPEQTRLIFEMSRFDGLPVKEIARKNKMTPKAVEYHITRSLKALRENLKDYLPLLIFLLK